MSSRRGRVVLLAWVDSVVRDYAREAASASGVEFSTWIERAVRETRARDSMARAVSTRLLGVESDD
jgi:hypothetical protein